MRRSARHNPLVALLSLLVLLLGGTALAERAPLRRALPSDAEPTPVRHDTKFHAVPDAKLELRAVQYDGSTNGRLRVQIRNPAKTAQKFSAQGLYFVPEGNPDTAPQRLGAVGPMQIANDGKDGKDGKEVSELDIAPGATVEVMLDVFCIDSHRPSPSPQNTFNVGAKRMPKELVQTIEKRADAAVGAARASGHAAPRPAAKASIQGEVWRSRDAKWVELDGEGKQEVGKKK